MFSATKSSGPSGYNLTRSLRFRRSATAYLSKTYSTSATNLKIQTFSVWVKRGSLSSTQYVFSGYDNISSGAAYLVFQADNTIRLAFDPNGTSFITTTQLFRDPSAWYHIVLAVDTTQATAANRIKLYVNGVQVTAVAGTYPGLNVNSQFGLTTINNNIGTLLATSNSFDGYLAEFNFIDGQALTPSSFGSTSATTGVWQFARYTGTYGTNGFYLPFTDNSALTTASNAGLGKDFSGNANYWTTNNISITAGVTYDSMTDVPTLTSATAANYATWNGVAIGTDATLSSGNLDISYGSVTPWLATAATIGMQSGQWYWEITITAASASPAICIIGISTKSSPNEISSYPGQNANGWGYYSNTGTKVNNASFTSYGATYTTGDVIGVAFDANAGTLVFYKNNTSQGTAFSSLTNGPYLPAIGDASGGSTFSASANFGQRPFSYTPPTGFVALNTYNLPASTVPNGAAYMAATLYTGTGASLTVANTVGSASFQPDLVWIKSRSAATDHKLTDSVRGVTKGLISNTTGAETTDTGGLTAFGSTGFTVSTNNDYNTSAATYVAWNWKAGGTGVTNTNGTITSTVSANTTSGFSVVTYTGNGSSSATVGHGLGVTPSMIIHSARSTTTSWFVNHVGIPNLWMQLYIYFTASSGGGTNGAIGYQSTNTSTTFGFTAGSSTVNNVNQSAATYVAYCFTPIKGFSAFGSYTGNSSTDGPFVYTGFRPRWIMLKNSNENYDWYIFDTSRSTYNLTTVSLYPDLINAEGTPSTAILDVLSNGFKLRGTSGGTNPVSTSTMVYAAFAENPFQNALAR